LECNLEKTLSIRLALLEERVLEMRKFLRTPGYRGNFYSLTQDLSPREREEMDALLEEVLQILNSLKGETSIPAHEEKTSRILAGMANTAFVSGLELEPKRMKGYGGDTPQYQEIWETRLRPIRDLFHALAQKTEEARK